MVVTSCGIERHTCLWPLQVCISASVFQFVAAVLLLIPALVSGGRVCLNLFVYVLPSSGQ